MKDWNKESDNSFKEKSEEELKVEKIVHKIIREEINKMTIGQGIFGKKFFKKIRVSRV